MTPFEIAAATTMEEILRAYPSAKVGLFQRYHVGGCDSCSYKPTETLEEVRKNFNIQDSVDEIVNVIRGSAEVFASLHIAPRDLASALRAGERLTLLDVRKPEDSHGSLERMPGALFHAMGTLVLQKNAQRHQKALRHRQRSRAHPRQGVPIRIHLRRTIS